MTCTDDGLDHLVPDAYVGDVRGPAGDRRFRALCGRSILPAAMVCPPLPRCTDCARHLDRAPSTVSRPPRRLRALRARLRAAFDPGREPAGALPVAREFLRQEVLGSPLAEPVGALEPPRLAGLADELDVALAPFANDSRFAGTVLPPMQTWLVGARRR